jgi:uncharacterized SAM-binding protein YcdF (DUF218 family)
MNVGSSVSGERRRRAWTGLVAGAMAGFIVLDLDLASLVSFWGDRTILVPAAAFVGAALWPTPLRRLAMIGVALLGALWLVVAFTPLTARMTEGLVRQDPLQAGDAVFVFASSIQVDDDPSPDAMSRLLRGLELVGEGRSRYLVVSELPRPQGRYTPLAEAWVERFAPSAEVLAVGPVYNTHDEAVAVARLFRERGWKRVLAVTSPTHTRRASAALEFQGLDVVAIPSVETGFDLEGLERLGDRREAFSHLAHEWVGLFVYRRRGWID